MMTKITQLNFPKKYQFRMREDDSDILIFCPLRKNFYQLTPEEWVRQHWVARFLDLGFTENCMSPEFPLDIQGRRQRVDLVVTKKTVPWLVLECKAPHIELKKEHLEQLKRYNDQIHATFLILSNGLKHFYWKWTGSSYEKQDHIDYNQKGISSSSKSLG